VDKLTPAQKEVIAAAALPDDENDQQDGAKPEGDDR
jgi:hypothetical protein